MKKYLAVIKTEWSRQMTYRTNQFTFRIGNIFEILVQILIWTAIFQKTAIVSGYNYREMITYIIIGWLLAFLMANFNFESIISNQVQQGDLSNFVTKPISYIKYLIFLSIGRSSFTLSVALLMNIILLIFFRHVFIFSGNIAVWLILIAMVVAGYFIKLFLSILIGFISFWSIDNSGIFFSVNAITKFLSGAYFPINILPAAFVNVSLTFPFVYTFYFPAQLYLGKVSIQQGLLGLGFEILWLVILYFAIEAVWKRGLKKFESVGI